MAARRRTMCGRQRIGSGHASSDARSQHLRKRALGVLSQKHGSLLHTCFPFSQPIQVPTFVVPHQRGGGVSACCFCRRSGNPKTNVGPRGSCMLLFTGTGARSGRCDRVVAMAVCHVVWLMPRARARVHELERVHSLLVAGVKISGRTAHPCGKCALEIYPPTRVP